MNKASLQISPLSPPPTTAAQPPLFLKIMTAPTLTSSWGNIFLRLFRRIDLNLEPPLCYPKESAGHALGYCFGHISGIILLSYKIHSENLQKNSKLS